MAKPKAKRTTAPKPKVKSAAKKPRRGRIPERAISVDLAGGRWLSASRGVALNKTNSFARARTTVVDCDPVDAVPIDDLALLAQTLENAVRRTLLKLPPITNWRDREPGPIAIAAGCKTWPSYLGSGARHFSIIVLRDNTEIAECRISGMGFSLTSDDPVTTLAGPPNFTAIAETLRQLSRRRPPRIGRKH